MKDKEKKDINSASSAENGVCIDAEKKAAVSEPQSGDTEGFDAGSDEKMSAEFESLIAGKYKKQFAERVHKIIDRRLKEAKKMKEKSNRNDKIAELLMQHCNITDGDTEKLERAVNTEMTQTKTDEEGRKDLLLKRLAAENAYLRRRQEEEVRSTRARSKADAWSMQAQDTKKLYPDFELTEELKNEKFRALLKAGVDVRQAYEVVHIDDILDKTSKNTEKKVVNSIRAKGNRPIENGTDPTGGILISNDVSKLTKKERADYAKRAAMGERIEF